jgi:cytochrome oxidase Cu insertion factor (SCO1/SenC/PrrC family)
VELNLNRRKAKMTMKLKTAAVLTALLGSSLPALSLAHDATPFAVLSTTIDAPAKRRAVPEFSLQERSGKNITLADLLGKVWIADFVYTSCTDTCPFQTADMARLQDRWRNESDLRLVSFSVDPEHDTPKVLSRYANRFKADPSRWLFLTGNRAAVSHLVEDGFHLAVAPALKGTHNTGVLLHSPRFVLVDRQGRIHGYYDNRDRAAMQRLQKDVTELLENK